MTPVTFIVNDTGITSHEFCVMCKRPKEAVTIWRSFARGLIAEDVAHRGLSGGHDTSKENESA